MATTGAGTPQYHLGSSTGLTYAQRVAQYHLLTMAELPESYELDAAFLSVCDVEQMRSGLEGLHRWVRALYQAALTSPAVLGLPAHPDLQPRTGSRWKASTDAFLALTSTLYGLGLAGVPKEDAAGPYLHVEQAALDAALAAAHVRKPQAAATALAA
jgi:hypothetical protein